MHEFAKVYSAKCILSSNSPKFAPAKVSLYTVYIFVVDKISDHEYIFLLRAKSLICKVSSYNKFLLYGSFLYFEKIKLLSFYDHDFDDRFLATEAETVN